MMKWLWAFAALISLAAAAPTAPAFAQGRGSPALPDVEIPYETFTLSNGLRVVVSTDRKAPVVAVGIWSGVGSRDEEPGRTGFAHLFEHLMFNGSENERATLSNGARVVLAQRSGAPLVEVSAQFDGGFTADVATARAGPPSPPACLRQGFGGHPTRASRA